MPKPARIRFTQRKSRERAGSEGAILAREQGDVEGVRPKPVAKCQIAGSHDIADGEANQRQAQDPARDLALIHG